MNSSNIFAVCIKNYFVIVCVLPLSSHSPLFLPYGYFFLRFRSFYSYLNTLCSGLTEVSATFSSLVPVWPVSASLDGLPTEFQFQNDRRPLESMWAHSSAHEDWCRFRHCSLSGGSRRAIQVVSSSCSPDVGPAWTSAQPHALAKLALLKGLGKNSCSANSCSLSSIALRNLVTFDVTSLVA